MTAGFENNGEVLQTQHDFVQAACVSGCGLSEDTDEGTFGQGF